MTAPSCFLAPRSQVSFGRRGRVRWTSFRSALRRSFRGRRGRAGSERRRTADDGGECLAAWGARSTLDNACYVNNRSGISTRTSARAEMNRPKLAAAAAAQPATARDNRRRWPGAQASTFAGRTAWARNLAAPVRDFLSTETGSAIVLLGATIVALLWANSPWSDSYESVWTTKLSINVGGERHLGRSAPLGQRGPDDVLLPRRRPRGQARARRRRAARAPPPRGPGARGDRRHDRAGRDLPARSTPAAPARTAGARRCRPTRPSRSARWRC